VRAGQVIGQSTGLNSQKVRGGGKPGGQAKGAADEIDAGKVEDVRQGKRRSSRPVRCDNASVIGNGWRPFSKQII